MIETVIKRTGLSYAAIAEECGVHIRTVYNWASGKTPVPHMAQLLLEGIAEHIESRQTLEQRIKTLFDFKQKEQEKIDRLEIELQSKRQHIKEINQQLNRLLSQQNRTQYAENP